MIGLTDEGKIREIFIKLATTSLRHTWIIAAWTPYSTGTPEDLQTAVLSGGLLLQSSQEA